MGSEGTARSFIRTKVSSATRRLVSPASLGLSRAMCKES